MKRQFIAHGVSALGVSVALIASSSILLAQAGAAPAAPQKATPRTTDGHPDLTGIWGGVAATPPAKDGSVQVLLRSAA